MNNFSIKESFRSGWEIYKQHTSVIFLATLILAAVNIVADKTHGVSFGAWFLWVPVTIVVAALHIGWTKLLLKIRDGEAGSLRELVAHGNLLLKYFSTLILFVIGALIGLILIIPGIYFIVRYQFAILLVIDKNLGVTDAFKESTRLTNGVKWKLIGFSLIAFLINVLGALPFGIGLLITMPLTTLAHMYIYRKLLVPVVGE